MLVSQLHLTRDWCVWEEASGLFPSYPHVPGFGIAGGSAGEGAAYRRSAKWLAGWGGDAGVESVSAARTHLMTAEAGTIAYACVQLAVRIRGV